MELPTSKQLLALAKACRKAGITSFKGNGIEFTLGNLPQAAYGSKSKVSTPPVDLGPTAIETDELVGDALLFWSSSDQPTENTEQ